MPDWKAMYLDLFRETERAIDILMNAQHKCEEMYINAPEPEIVLLPRQDAPEQEKIRKIFVPDPPLPPCNPGQDVL